MLSSRNLLKPATGEPIAVPHHDIILGCYYLTRVDLEGKGKGRAFSSRTEALLAFDVGAVAINAPILIYENSGKLETSVGRVIFNSALPSDFPFVNQQLNKKALLKVVGQIIRQYGTELAPECLDNIKNIGFEYATHSGITWGMDDLRAPKEKAELMAAAEKSVQVVREQYENGFLTEAERHSRIVSVWTEVKNKIAKVVPTSLDSKGSMYSIIDSGARGSWAQATQVVGIKGLVQNSRSETIELPIKSSYKEGLNALEYFIATHGARKGTTDTALKTAAAGYLTRRLVDVAQDTVIREDDCRTKEGITMHRKDGLEFGHLFADRLFSRTLAEDVKDGRKVIAKEGEIVDRKMADAIDANEEIKEVRIKSPITCKTLYGICASCYGYDLGKNAPIEKGEAVGVVAAQSIGEPGTQLTMRTFHVGGVAGADITHGLPRVVEVFEVRPPKGKAFLAEEDGIISDIETRDLLKIVKIRELGSKSSKGGSASGGKEKLVEYPIPHTSEVLVKVGDEVKRGDRLCVGNLDLRELFEIKGREEVEREVVRAVQKIYMSEGAPISNKHLEIIVRQMFSRVKIKDAGDTDFVAGEVIEKSRFLEYNRRMKKAGKAPAKAKQLLLGITKVALSTESFLSAASFQETARVLINAAVDGKVDVLRGLKENVIIGRSIPVGINYMKGESIPEREEEEGN